MVPSDFVDRSLWGCQCSWVCLTRNERSLMDFTAIKGKENQKKKVTLLMLDQIMKIKWTLGNFTMGLSRTHSKKSGIKQ